jgi:hypothetical protein
VLLDILLLSLLVAFLRGGRPSPSLGLKKSWLILIAFALQILAIFLPVHLRPVIVLLSYAVLLGALALNGQRQSIRLILVGVLLNVVVISMNNGKMPVSLPAAERLNFDTTPLVVGSDFKRIAMSDDTHFNFLGDVIYTPAPIPRVFSLGDIFIAFGAFFLIQEFMGRPITLRVSSLRLSRPEDDTATVDGERR